MTRCILHVIYFSILVHLILSESWTTSAAASHSVNTYRDWKVLSLPCLKLLGFIVRLIQIWAIIIMKLRFVGRSKNCRAYLSCWLQNRIDYIMPLSLFILPKKCVWLREFVFWRRGIASVFQSVSVELQCVNELKTLNRVLILYQNMQCDTL